MTRDSRFTFFSLRWISYLQTAKYLAIFGFGYDFFTSLGSISEHFGVIRDLGFCVFSRALSSRSVPFGCREARYQALLALDPYSCLFKTRILSMCKKRTENGSFGLHQIYFFDLEGYAGTL